MAETWQHLVVMKSLPAEYRALRSLGADVSRSLTPLVQLWDRMPTPEVEEEGEEDGHEGQEPQSDGLFGQQPIWGEGPGERVWRRLQRGLRSKSAGAWPKDRAILLDGGWLPSASDFATVLVNCLADGFSAVAVTGIDRPAAYQQAVADVASPARGGLVIRLRPADFGTRAAALAEGIDGVLAATGLEPSSCDIVLDLGCLDPAFDERDEMNAESMLRALPRLGDWRNVATVGSSTPQDVRGFDRDDIRPYRRLEWRLWLELRARRGSLGRLPAYGDYGVIHPARVEPMGAQRKLPRIPKLLWATRDEMLMVRGHDLRGGDDGGLADLRARLEETGDLPSPDFSAGDRWFARAAGGLGGPGSWGTWKWAGQVHLLTHTSLQLANLAEPRDSA